MIKRTYVGVILFTMLIVLIGIIMITFSILMLIPEVQSEVKIASMQQLKELSEKAFGSMSPDDLERASTAIINMERSAAIRRLIYGILIFVSGIAILLRRNWGRILFLAIILIGLVSSAIGLYVHRAGVDKGLVPTIIVLTIAILASLFYLTRPKVKEQFE